MLVYPEKLEVVVYVLVIPVVTLPLGSLTAKQNSISQSAATPAKAEGTDDASELFFLKSSFRISICDSICAVEIF
jgi:hypothetical protein